MKANRKFINADERAVSAVIGVILMVAITVAIAATVYVYVSGMLGGGPQSTPNVSLSVTSEGAGCTIMIGTPTSSSIEWSEVYFTCSNLTGHEELVRGTDLGMTWPARATSEDVVKGGQAIYITSGLSSGPGVNSEYQFTLVYNVTGGTMGTVKWTQ